MFYLEQIMFKLAGREVDTNPWKTEICGKRVQRRAGKCDRNRTSFFTRLTCCRGFSQITTHLPSYSSSETWQRMYISDSEADTVSQRWGQAAYYPNLSADINFDLVSSFYSNSTVYESQHFHSLTYSNQLFMEK